MANSLAHIARYGDGNVLTAYEPTLREKVNYWLARNWYGDTREGVDKASKLSNVLETVTPYGIATMAYDAGRAGASGRPVEAGLLAAMAAAPLPAAAEKKAAQGIRAYHGSPHSFDRFSLDKIGTGEGAQAYGHGLYFAENEGVAKGYRDTLSKSGTDGAQGRLKAAGGDIDKAIADAQNRAAMYRQGGAENYASAIEEDLRFLEKYKQTGEWTPGSMYEVNIKANPDDFLDWDKPLSEQGPKAKAAADKIFDPGWNDGSWTPTGENLIGKVDQRKRAEILKEAGIPGIKYLDAGSRGTSGGEILGIVPDGNSYRAKIKKFGGGAIGSAPTDMVTTSKPFASEQEARKWAEGQIATGTRNYVVFDEKLIEIVKKYGIAGASAMLGMDVLANMDEAQAATLKNAESEGGVAQNRFAKYAPQNAQQAPQGGNRFSKYAKTAPAVNAAVRPSQGSQTVNSEGKGDMGAAPGEVSASTYAADMGRSALSGVRSGLEMLAGTAGDVQNMSGDVAGWLAAKAGLSPEAQGMAKTVGRTIAVPGLASMPDTETIQGATNTVAGPAYEPQTTPGKFARTIGEFAPNAVAGPGGVARKAAMTVVPAVASEALGQAAEGSDYEAVARAGGAVAGALATGGRGKASKLIAKGAPTQESVASKTRDAYGELKRSGVSFDSKQFERVLNYAAKKLTAEGITQYDTPRTLGQVKRLADMVGGPIEYTELESIRRGLTGIMSDGIAVSNTDKAAAKILRDSVDALTRSGKAKTNGLISPREANAKMKTARELGQRNIIARDLDEMARKAENYTSGYESGMKLQLKSYLNSKQGRMLAKTSPEVYRAFQEARGGSLTRNALATLGRAGVDLSPTGAIAALVPALAGGAAYYGTGGDLAQTAAVVAAASGARFGSKRLHGRDFTRAKDVVLAGKGAQKSVGAAVKARNTATVATAGLSANQSRPRDGTVAWPENAFLQDAKGRFFDRNGKLIPAAQ